MQLLMELAEFSCKATLVVGIGALCAGLSSRRSAAWRNRIWRLTLLGVSAIPLCMVVGDVAGRETAMPLFQASEQTYLRPVMTYSGVPFASSVPESGKAVPLPNVPEPGSKFDPAQLILGLYALGATVSLGTFTRSLILARRTVAASQPLPLTEPGLRPTAPLRASAELSVPATFGLLSPVILLPTSALSWPSDRLQAAVRHEGAHIQRRDWIWQMVARGVAALQWFNPAIWFLRERLQSSAEEAADDHVLESGFGAVRYARELMEVAAGGRSPGSVVTMAGRGDLKRRLKRILAARSDRGVSPPGAWFRYAVVALLIVGTVAIGVVGAHGFRRGSIASFGPGKPFYGPVKLRDGSRIRVEYLQDWSVAPNSLWRPDGGSVSAEVRQTSLHVPAPAAPSTEASTLRLRISTTGTCDPANWTIRVPFETPWATFQTYGLGANGPFMNLACVKLPPSVDQTDVRVGVASGPWRVCETVRWGEGLLCPTPASRSTKGAWHAGCIRLGPTTDGKEPVAPPLAPAPPPGRGSDPNPVFVAALPTAGEVCVNITIPERYRDMQTILKAYATAASGEHELPTSAYQIDGLGTGSYPEGTRQFVFVGKGETPTRFELVGRPYEWVTFRGIRTKPK